MTTMTTTKRTKDETRGFPGLRCLACGEEDAVRVGLADMGLTCSSCDREFSVADVRDTLAAWNRVIAWIEQSPVVK